MRFTVFVAALTLGLLSAAAEEAPPVTVEHAPKLVCNEPSYDFGTADSSQTIEHTYIIKNEGDLTLEISNVKPSCGCTVANISERSVAPGAETKVTARLALQGRSGQQHKSITVESNDPKQPQFILSLQGNIGNTVDIKPPSVIFGEVGQNSVVTQFVDIAATGPVTFKVTQVESMSPNFAAQLSTLEENKLYRVTITTQGQLPAGALYGNVRVTTDLATRPVFDIPVSTMVVGALIVAPQEIVLAQQDQPVTRYVVVRPGMVKQFQVEKVEAPDERMTSQVFPFGDNGFRIQIDNIVASADLNGKSVHVKTSAEGMTDVAIPLRVVAAPVAGQPAPAPTP
jgi:hypothetical protein